LSAVPIALFSIVKCKLQVVRGEIPQT
jgi:hypothetical protein